MRRGHCVGGRRHPVHCDDPVAELDEAEGLRSRREGLLFLAAGALLFTSVYSYFVSNVWLIFGKLKEARSRLYRSRFLQVNTRLKALGEIYKIYIPLHLSDLNNSANFRRKFL